MPRRRCYPSDTFDDEWALIEPLLPPPACDSPKGGRPEKHLRREIVDAIRYVVDTGCKWQVIENRDRVVIFRSVAGEARVEWIGRTC